MRSQYCGALNASHINQEVTLCGWADRRRDHGGVIFVGGHLAALPGGLWRPQARRRERNMRTLVVLSTTTLPTWGRGACGACSPGSSSRRTGGFATGMLCPLALHRREMECGSQLHPMARALLATCVASARTTLLVGGVDWPRAVHCSDFGPAPLGVMPGNSSKDTVGPSHCPCSVPPLLERGGCGGEG